MTVGIKTITYFQQCIITMIYQMKTKTYFQQNIITMITTTSPQVDPIEL